MNTKKFSIIRLEKSKVLKKISYEVVARNKRAAIKKLNKMQYNNRDTIDEIQEDSWKSIKIISVDTAEW